MFRETCRDFPGARQHDLVAQLLKAEPGEIGFVGGSRQFGEQSIVLVYAHAFSVAHWRNVNQDVVRNLLELGTCAHLPHMPY